MVIVVPDMLIIPEPAITEYVNAPELLELGWTIVKLPDPNVRAMLKSPIDGYALYISIVI